MKRIAIPAATLAAVLTTGLILAGCSNDTAPSNTPTVAAPTDTTPAAVGTPAPEPTPAALEVGQELNGDEELVAGQKAFEMPDGSTVLVQKDQPLPKAVVKVLNKKVTKAWMPGQGLKTDGNYGQLYADTITATGKKAVIVGKSHGAPANDMWNFRELWTIVGPRGVPTDPNGTWTEGTAVKAAKKWVKEQENPQDYVVIVQD